MYTKRRVLYVGGYDPVAPADFFSRQARHLARFETTWDVTAHAAEPAVSADGVVWRRQIATTAEGWTTETDFRLLAWDDLVKRDFAKPLWQRMPLSIGALADFVVSGTIIRYFLHAWRFGLYFMMPYLATLSFIAAGMLVAFLVLAVDVPGAGLGATLLGVAAFAVLMRWPGQSWFVPHLLDARTFMGQYVRGDRPDMVARLERFAAEVIDAVSVGDVDELLVIGHSQGSVFALECVERALSIDPERLRRMPISILTVGSCVLQIGLNPAARRAFIPQLLRLKEEPTIDWLEFQALSDPVNFYKTDPAALMGLGKRGKGAFPAVHIVRIRDMLTPEAYARTRKSLFRLHYQFVTGNTRRYWYDFYMICCGPYRIPTTLWRRKPKKPDRKAIPKEPEMRSP